MDKNLGGMTAAVFHTPTYLNYYGAGCDIHDARHWSSGWIERGQKTARRKYRKRPASTLVVDRLIYLCSDYDFVARRKGITVWEVLYADSQGRLSFWNDRSGAHAIEVNAEHGEVISIPGVVDGGAAKYVALASSVSLPGDKVEAWLQTQLMASADPTLTNIAYQIGWVDFNYMHTFLGTVDMEFKRGSGDLEPEAIPVLRIPVFDPLLIARRQANELSEKLREYEEEFGFQKSLIHTSCESASHEVEKWTRHRLALMLDGTRDPRLKDKVDDLRRPLRHYLSLREDTHAAYRTAVDLAAGNLASWLQRHIVLAWIDLCHREGVGVVVDGKPDGDAGTAKARILEEMYMNVRDLLQTRPGNVLAEIWGEQADTYSFLEEYLFDGKPLKGVKWTRDSAEGLLAIQTLVLGRMIARGKRDFAEILGREAGYLVDAGLAKPAEKIWDTEATIMRQEPFWRSMLTDGTLIDERVKLGRVIVDVEKLESSLTFAENANHVLGLVGWVALMDDVHSYSERARRGQTEAKDHVAVGLAVVDQTLATAQVLLGDTVETASRAGLRVGLSSLGLVVNVVDACIKMGEAQDLFEKGDTDAALLTGASAGLVILLAIPFGLGGLWLGVGLATVAGILGIVAEVVTDDAWDTFLKSTPYSLEAGGGDATPDWAGPGISLKTLRGSAALQLRAFVNLLNNFSVRLLGGGLGDGFGNYTLELTMATADSMAVFHLIWTWEASGAGVQTSASVASVFGGDTTPADGAKLRLPGRLRGPDGTTSLDEYERAAVRKEGATVLHVGEPLSMRPYQIPFTPHSEIRGLSVEVRRLLIPPFGRKRSPDTEWTEAATLDLTVPVTENRTAMLFKDVDEEHLGG